MVYNYNEKNSISKSEAEEFYKVHQSKPFYVELVIIYLLEYSCNDSEKENAVLENRKLMGATDPTKAERHDKKKYGILLIKILFTDLILENAKLK